MSKFYHFGLYFTEKHALSKKTPLEFSSHANGLYDLYPPQALITLQQAAYHTLNGTAQAPQHALDQLLTTIASFSPQHPNAQESLKVLAHSYEILRAHLNAQQHTHFAQHYHAHYSAIANAQDQAQSPAQYLQFAHLQLVSGIVLEQDDLITQATDAYHAAIHDIHPQGYFNAITQDPNSFYEQFFAVRALVLIAEAASHIGIDLWRIENRQVSVLTAFSYLLYYFFFPEKWHWGNPADQAPYYSHGGFLDIVNYRHNSPDLKTILKEIRPIYDPAGGGWTTFTHENQPKRSLFGRI